MTLLEALRYKLDYPLDEPVMELILLDRGLDGSELYDAEVGKSRPFVGAVADGFKKLVTTPDVGESGITISLPDRELFIKRMNELYDEIGEVDNMLVPRIERISFYG